jgi:TIR domain-containing protein/uncharacterized protein DUF4190
MSIQSQQAAHAAPHGLKADRTQVAFVLEIKLTNQHSGKRLLLRQRMTVIISYRRDDTGAITGRICDRLRARFGAERIYMDIDSNPIGVDYRSHIDESLKRCDILLAVIGRHWLGTGDLGDRRIDDASDLVRLEVTSALTRGIRVVPILVDDTEMPSAEELPEDLTGLKFRQAFRVDSGVDFHHHLDRLCDAIAAAAPNSVAATGFPPPFPKPPPVKRIEREASQDTVPKPYESVRLSGRTSKKPRVSKFAIAALICSGPGPCLGYLLNETFHLGSPVSAGLFAFSLFGLSSAAIVCGRLARKQIRGNPSLSGNGLAMTGLALGSVELLFVTIVIIIALIPTAY